MMDTKPIWQSKTVWLNAIALALSVVWPSGAAMVQSNPEASMLVVTVLNVILRLVTKQPVSLV